MAGIAADSSSYQTTSLTPNTQYIAQVAAYRSDRGAASSSNSSAVYTLANVPNKLSTSTDSTTQVTLSWLANSNPGGTEYYAENTTASTNSGWTTATSWASTGLTCGTTYSLRVRARNGDGTVTNFATAVTADTSACPTAPTAPSGATATYNSDVQITLSWTDRSSDEDSFIAERRKDTGAGYGAWTAVATTSANATSFVDNSANDSADPPVANRKFQYRVRAYNVAGYSSYSTDASDVFTAPAAPTIGAPTVDSVSAITWAWTDNAAFESSYRLGFTTGSSTLTAGLAADSSSYQTIGLATNTAYAVQVAAYRADRGVASSSISATTYTLAAIPITLATTSDSASQATLSWGDNGNPAGTEYYAENVTASTNSGWITAASWASTGLTCGTTYSLRVRARNGASTTTSFATAVEVATAACPVETPSPPSGAPMPPPAGPSGGGQESVSGSTGGSVSGELAAGGTASVVIPADSLAGSLTVSVVSRPELQIPVAPLSTSQQLVGSLAFDVSVTIGGLFTVRSLGVPVPISVTYQPEQIRLAMVNERTLRLYRLNEATSRWLPLESTVDTVRHVVTAYTDHFSLFAVIGERSGVAAAPLKVVGDPRVYLVANGYRRHIPNEASFLSYGFRWADVRTVSAAELSRFPETTLIKVAADPRVYAVEGGQRRWVPDEATFLSRGFSWAAIATVNATELAVYPVGVALSGVPSTAGIRFTGSLRLGMSGAEVRRLQDVLRSAGFFGRSSTGYFATATEAAVRAFQRSRGIEAVGYVGPATRAALNVLP